MHMPTFLECPLQNEDTGIRPAVLSFEEINDGGLGGLVCKF